MTKMKSVNMQLPDVAGYEYSGEYRSPKIGEHFLSAVDALVKTAGTNMTAEFPILRPAPKWRDARPGDLENGPVHCRYSDNLDHMRNGKASEGYFCNYDACKHTDYAFGVCEDADGEQVDSYWRYCQVKDE